MGAPTTSNGQTGVELTPKEVEKLAARAHEVEQNIVKGARAMLAARVWMAGQLYAFFEERMWEVLGYDTEKQFFASPETETLSHGYARKLARAYRELVVERNIPVKELAGVDIEKVQAALPAVRAGKAEWKQVLSDAEVMPRHDFLKHYRDGRDAPIDPSREPARVQCPTCQSWVDADKVEEQAA